MAPLQAAGVTGTIRTTAGRPRLSPQGLAVFHDRRGSASLEFGMVALLFVFWLISSITLGLHILAQAAIDSATQAAGRQIQIGAIRGGSADAVRSLICASLQGTTPTCSTIQVYATSGLSFGTLMKASVSGTKMSPTSFDAGGPAGGLKSYVLLQVAYENPFTVPLAGLPGLILVSSIAFRNEPGGLP